MKKFLTIISFLVMSLPVKAASTTDTINAIQEAEIQALKRRLTVLEQAANAGIYEKDISCLGAPQDILDLTLLRAVGPIIVQISEEGFGTGTNALYLFSRVYEGWNIKELAYTDRVNNGTRVMSVRCKDSTAASCRLQISVKDNASGDGTCTTGTHAVVQILNGRNMVKAELVP